MAGFSINSILNGVSQAPAGERMDVALIEHGKIKPNPENRKIYHVGDVSALKADILTNGLRQPLEVIPADGDTWTLLGGERRWTAIGQLLDEDEANRARFGRVPCIVRQSRGADDDLLALITANSTARELTDGERLAQYEALKAIFEKKKAAGELTGRVRDAMAETLGVGAGTLGRLNAIAEHCLDEVKDMLREGKTTLTKAYEASKLWKRQQVAYIRNGYSASLPDMTGEQRKAVCEWIAEYPSFSGVDWTSNSLFTSGFCEAVKELDKTVEFPFGRVRFQDGNAYLLDADDPDDAESEMYLFASTLWGPARAHHMTPEEKAEMEASRAAPVQMPAADAYDIGDEAPGGAEDDVSTVDTRKDQLDEIVDELLTGDLPGMWTLMRRDDALHLDVYTLGLMACGRLYMLHADTIIEGDCPRLFLRVDDAGAIMPMDGHDPGSKGWMTCETASGRDAVRCALRVAAALLLDKEGDGEV